MHKKLSGINVSTANLLTSHKVLHSNVMQFYCPENLKSQLEIKSNFSKALQHWREA